MNRTRIEWCDRTWNPVTGCLYGCQYCYAERIAKRFCTNEHGREGLLSPCSGDCTACSEMDGLEFLGDKIRVSHGNEIFPFGFFPTLHLNRMSHPAGIKKPQNVFVCSMSDLFGDWVPDDWIKKVFDHCYLAPQHTYLFLTKNPKRYYDVIEYLETDVKNHTTPPGIFLGATAANNDQLNKAYESSSTWISIEPLQEELYTDECFMKILHPDRKETQRWMWVVIGAETGNRKNKIIPHRDWIKAIVDEFRFWKTPVFMKNSLKDIWGEPLIQEYPWEVPE